MNKLFEKWMEAKCENERLSFPTYLLVLNNPFHNVSHLLAAVFAYTTRPGRLLVSKNVLVNNDLNKQH